MNKPRSGLLKRLSASHATQGLRPLSSPTIQPIRRRYPSTL